MGAATMTSPRPADLAAAILQLELEDAVVPHHADELADLGDVHARGPGPRLLEGWPSAQIEPGEARHWKK